MPKPRVPTASLEARGSFMRHPERKRARANEPVPSRPLSAPPLYLAPAEMLIWQELSAKLPANVAFDDETAFEVLVCLVSAFRKRQALFQPHVVGELASMNKLFTQFGMTPADRSKVKTSDDNAQDPLEAFLSAKPSRETPQ